MASQYYELNRKEKRTRRFWLLATIVYYSLDFLLLLPIFLIRAQLSMTTLYVLAPLIIKSIFPLWLIWHCAYRKPGTAFLTFVLIVGPLQFIGIIKDLLAGNYNAIWGAVIIFALYMGWYILSLELRKINKKIQAHKRDYLESLKALEELKPLVESQETT